MAVKSGIQLPTLEHAYNSIWKNESTNDDRIVQIPVDSIEPNHRHTFKMIPLHISELAADIKENGLQTPVIVLDLGGGKYEMLAGHHRLAAFKMNGMDNIPAIVKRGLSDTEQVNILVNSNFRQRHKLLPSELAQSFKLLVDTYTHQGRRGENGEQSRDTVAAMYNISGTQVSRYIRLLDLSDEFMIMLDEGNLSFTSGVHLSYLTIPEQRMVFDELRGRKLSGKSAARLHDISGALTPETVRQIIDPPKSPEHHNFKITGEDIKSFPALSALDDTEAKTEIIRILNLYYDNL